MNRTGTQLWRITAALLLSLVLSSIWSPSVSWAESAAQVDEVRQLLEQNHLSKPDDAALNQTAIDAMVNSLHDPYTQYFNADEWNSFNSSLEQNFIGVGIVMTEAGGSIFIEDVVPGSPAQLAGIQPGDTIVSADGAATKGLTVTELQKKLRGEEGSTVTLGVSRGRQKLSFRLTRKSLQVPAAAGKMMGEGVGYLALSGFTSDAGDVFRKELDKLETAGMTSLVIDLRNNGGGYVSTAQQIAGLFIRDGILAHMKDRDGNDNPITIQGGVRKPYPVTVLVNGDSASASELLAGALQDYRVAKLVGTKTFGKGVVQSIVPLKSGGVLKVTVQEYTTPKGRKVDKTGLKPEHVVEGSGEQLIAAFRDAGGRKLTMTAGKGVIKLNGIRTANPDAAKLRGKDWFVNLRLASAMVGADVRFDKKTQVITLTKDGKTHRLASTDPRLMHNSGWNLIDVRTLKVWFPGLTAKISGGELQLIAG